MAFSTGLASLFVLVFATNIAVHQSPDCQRYLAWLSILEKELASVQGRTMEHLAPRAVNAFRDEYFVPFYGKPFEKSTPDERREFYFAIRNSCQLAPTSAERKLFLDWDAIVQRAFLMPDEGIVKALAERKALLARMKTLIDAKRSATRESFEALNKEIGTAKAELAKLWPREEQELLRGLTETQRTLAASSPESSRIATIVDAEAGVEGSPSGGAPTKNDYVYIDAVIAKGGQGNQETLPVEQVFQWLYDQKFKCLSTTVVGWRGAEGQARATQFGEKRFVIDCRGNCKGLRYRIIGRTDAMPWHYGLSQPVPVINLKGSMFVTNDFNWAFTRANTSEAPPTVKIHAWSSTLGDYGPGCRIE